MAATGTLKCSREEPPHVRGQGQEPGGPHTRRATAKRSYPASEVRGGGREEQPHIQGAVAARAQEGLEELPHVEGQEGGSEEIPLILGKEQWLHFAGAAVKRYPMPKVRENQVRRYVLEEGIRGQTH